MRNESWIFHSFLASARGDNLTPGLEQPDNILYPFTTGVKAAYLEYFSYASLEHKGITGGLAMLGGASVFEVCNGNISRLHSRIAGK